MRTLCNKGRQPRLASVLEWIEESPATWPFKVTRINNLFTIHNDIQTHVSVVWRYLSTSGHTPLSKNVCKYFSSRWHSRGENYVSGPPSGHRTKISPCTLVMWPEENRMRYIMPRVLLRPTWGDPGHWLNLSTLFFTSISKKDCNPSILKFLGINHMLKLDLSQN